MDVTSGAPAVSVLDGTSEEVPGSVVDCVSKDIVGSVLDGASEEVPGSVADATSEEPAGVLVDGASKELTDSVIEVASKEVARLLLDGVSEEIADLVVGVASEEAAVSMVDGVSEDIAGPLLCDSDPIISLKVGEEDCRAELGNSDVMSEVTLEVESVEAVGSTAKPGDSVESVV